VPESKPRFKALFLAVGIAINIFTLGYYKYFYFFVDIVNTVLQTSYVATAADIPLGVSFLTFVQIAYLVDVCNGTSVRSSFLHYCVFVTFFPKLIAGPIVRHEQFLPQLLAPSNKSSSRAAFIAEGLTVFAFGLFKKVVLADSLGRGVDPLFASISAGTDPSFVEAWIGVLSYTFQLYFDFSGYTDMAIGLAQTFGISLPQNFKSPYKATSIIDFWRRWHITFSTFLRDYLYIPMGGNRKGIFRQHWNLLATMMLGGLWHGANWTFIIWGALHGVFLIVNHIWTKMNLPCPPLLGRTITFLSVVMAWGWFRAENVSSGIRLCKSLVGVNGLLPTDASLKTFLRAIQTPSPNYEFFWSIFHDLGVAVSFGERTIYPMDLLLSEMTLTVALLLTSAIITFYSPNTQEWLRSQKQQDPHRVGFRQAILVGLLFYAAFLASISVEKGSFIYRQF
jgi:alginate O-acetyltransferase complex protein AlgI